MRDIQILQEKISLTDSAKEEKRSNENVKVVERSAELVWLKKNYSKYMLTEKINSEPK